MGLFNLFKKKELSDAEKIDSVANIIVNTFIANRKVSKGDGTKAHNLTSQMNPFYPTFRNQYVKTDEEKGVVELINNPYAKDVTFKEVIIYFMLGRANQFMWEGDWAYLIHNDAEAYGIRCGWVLIPRWHDTKAKIEKFGKDTMGTNDKYFACLSFNTTDQGLVYIDCVPDHQDYLTNITYANVEVGQEYLTFGLFISDYQSSMMFIVDDFCIFW